MYKQIRKKAYNFLMVLILIFASFQHIVCADMPLKYQFKPWTGQEDALVVINGQGSNAVLKLVCNGTEIQKADYSVETKENDLLLTIREEYLKTLDDGTYNMVLYFEPEPTLYEYGSEVSVGEKDCGISISGVDMTTFDKLLCGDEEVLADSYLAITTEDSIRIEFKEEYKDYVEELNEKNKTFYMVFMNSELVWLDLEVDIKDDSILGDVDANGEVQLNDAQFALKAALKIIELDEVQTKTADVDANEMIDLNDAQNILKYALKIIDKWD